MLAPPNLPNDKRGDLLTKVETFELESVALSNTDDRLALDRERGLLLLLKVFVWLVLGGLLEEALEVLTCACRINGAFHENAE